MGIRTVFAKTNIHKIQKMKLIGLTAALFSGVAYSAFPGSPVADFEWLAWKQTHSFKFPTRQEEARRYSIFSENRKFIAAHNARAAKGQETYTVGLNKFAAWNTPNSKTCIYHPSETIQ